MSIVISANLVLTEDEAGLTIDHPIIGWHNIVTVDNIAATSEAAGYPVTNLANPATHLPWKASSTAQQYLTVTTGSADDIDYVGFAKPNFAAAGIAVSFEGDDGGGYDQLIAPNIPASDGPLLFRITASPFTAVRVKLASGSAAASLGVLYVGKLLTLPRRLYQGFTPPSHGRMGSEINAMSESGDYLGSIITQQHVESKVPFSLVDPDYCREHIDPFFAARVPFFFGWRPQSYPREIGYMRLTNWPQPAPQSPHSLIAFALEMSGVV